MYTTIASLLFMQLPNITKEVEAIVKADGGVNAAVLGTCVVLVFLIVIAAGVGLRQTHSLVRDISTSHSEAIDKVLGLVNMTVDHCAEEMRMTLQSHAESREVFERTLNRLADENADDRSSRRESQHAERNERQQERMADKAKEEHTKRTPPGPRQR